MNLINGLPAQQDGDMQDTLNRCGLICICRFLKVAIDETLYCSCYTFIFKNTPNFVRYPGGNPKTTSGDQILPLWCMKALGYDIYIRNLFFASNTVDTTPGKRKIPIGDLIIFRTLPLWARSNGLGVFRYLADICLISLAIGDLLYYRISDDGADCNNTCVTLMTCNRVQPTFISRTVWRLWKQHSDFEKRLRRYHRVEALANPEIAEWLIEAAIK